MKANRGRGTSLGVWIGVGLAIGAGVGAAIDNIGAGVGRPPAGERSR